jgi:hypothetical protein
MYLPVRLEHAYDPLMADEQKPQVKGRWWNGQWGTMARRDIRLTHNPDGTALLEWWSGDDRLGGTRTYPAEQRYMGLIHAHELIDRDGGDGWVDLTAVSQ